MSLGSKVYILTVTISPGYRFMWNKTHLIIAVNSLYAKKARMLSSHSFPYCSRRNALIMESVASFCSGVKTIQFSNTSSRSSDISISLPSAKKLSKRNPESIANCFKRWDGRHRVPRVDIVHSLFAQPRLSRNTIYRPTALIHQMAKSFKYIHCIISSMYILPPICRV